jgi:hypothetical protein
MFFIQDAPPDTSAYMLLGYGVAFTVMTVYVASLFIRWRNLQRDLETLRQLEAEKRPGASASR